MKKAFVVFMLIWVTIFKIPIAEWESLTPQQKKEVLRDAGQNYCLNLDQDCSEARVIALKDKESVYLDAVCTKKEIKGLIRM